MKEIISQYREPMVLILLDPKFGRMSTRQNLLSGETIEVEDNQISPECKVLEKKKYIKIVDKPVSPPDEEEDLAELEKELLGDNDDQE